MIPLLIIFLRAIILYCVLILTVRLMGKRQIGELQPSELAVTILISNIATLPVEDVSIPLITGLIPILTIGSLDVIMSYMGMRHGRIRTFMSGRPVVIISNGKIDQSKMHELRFTVDDLMQAVRSENIFDISEVQFAVVETTGKVSVYPKTEYQNATAGDLGKSGESSDPPVLAVEDGILLEDNLKAAGADRQWLEKELREKNLSVKDIYMLTVLPSEGDRCKINTVILRSGKT